MSSIPTIPSPSDPGAAHVITSAIGVGRRYEPGGILGRGGMGEVWLARDTWLGRDVALKRARAHDADAGRRLAREAAMTAELEHPNIIPVYEAGRDEDGRPFYTMRLLTGRSLADVLGDAAMPLSERIGLVRHVLGAAEAMAHAHGRGVLHRDLKPANVMVGGLGETVVADWGLACRVDEVQAGRLGTPGYISPEQDAGEPVGTPADVYGLGAILYNVLVGAPPPAKGPAPAIRTVTPGVPPELAAIADRALAPAIADRYPSARALADDLLAWFEGRRVGAHEYSSRELASRFLAAYRLPLGVGSVAAVLLTIAVAVGWAGTAEERRRAVASEAEARAAEAAVQGALADALVAEGRTAAAAERWMEAEILAVNALIRKESAEARGLLARVAGPRATLIRTEPISDCAPASLSERGETVGCVDASGLRLVDVSAGPPRVFAQTSGSFRLLEVASATDVFASTPDNRALFWAPPAAPFELPRTGILLSGARALSRKPDVAWVETTKRVVRVERDLHTAEELIVCDNNSLRAFDALEDGTVYSVCTDLSVSRRGISGERRVIARLEDADGVGSAMRGLPDGRVVVGTFRGVLLILDAEGRRLFAREVASEQISTIGVFEDRILVGAVGGLVQVWELPAAGAEDQGLGAPLLRLQTGGRMVLSDRDTLRVLRTEREGSVLEDREVPAHVRVSRLTFDSGASAVAWSGDGAALAVSTGEGGVHIVDTTTGRIVRRSSCGKDVVKDVTWIGEEVFVATAGGEQCRIPIEGEPSQFSDVPLRRLATLPDGQLLALPYKGPAYRIDPATGAVSLTDRTSLGDVEVVGQEIAAADDHDVVWHGRDPKALERVGSLENIRAVAPLGPDSIVASGNVIVRFDGQGREVQRVSSAPLNEIATSPDLRWIAVGGYDGSITLWPADLSAPVAVLTGHTARIGGLAFSPDGARLASAGWDGELRFWALGELTTPAADLRRAAEREWGRSLSDILRGVVVPDPGSRAPDPL